MPKLLSQLSAKSINKLTHSPHCFETDKDINQICGGGTAFYWLYFTPLMYAAHSGDLALTKELVENGAELNKRDDSFDNTALIWASSNGKYETVRYLLEQNADSAYESKCDDYYGGDAYARAKKSPFYTKNGFFARVQEIFGDADYDHTRTLLAIHNGMEKTNNFMKSELTIKTVVGAAIGACAGLSMYALFASLTVSIWFVTMLLSGKIDRITEPSHAGSDIKEFLSNHSLGIVRDLFTENLIIEGAAIGAMTTFGIFAKRCYENKNYYDFEPKIEKKWV